MSESQNLPDPNEVDLSLLPCPFCGGRAELSETPRRSFVECYSCFAEGPEFEWLDTGVSDEAQERSWIASRQKAVAAWNTRHAPALERP